MSNKVLNKEELIINLIENSVHAKNFFSKFTYNRVESSENKSYTINDHFRWFIIALLVNDKTKAIEDNWDKIEEIFSGFDIHKVLSKLQNDSYQYFVNKVKSIRCGNRRINSQMRGLEYNIELLLKWEKEYGSMDIFLRRMSAKDLVYSLTKPNLPNKIKEMDVSTLCDYLKNVGIDTPKPDSNLRRILGADRLGYSNSSPAKEKEVFDIIESFNKNTGLSRTYIDFVLWNYCAKDYGNICRADPKCDKCDIRDYCNYKNK